MLNARMVNRPTLSFFVRKHRGFLRFSRAKVRPGNPVKYNSHSRLNHETACPARWAAPLLLDYACDFNGLRVLKSLSTRFWYNCS